MDKEINKLLDHLEDLWPFLSDSTRLDLIIKIKQRYGTLGGDLIDVRKMTQWGLNS